MSRYIKTDALMEDIWSLYRDEDYIDYNVAIVDALNVIDEQPTADVVEVVRCCDADKGDCMFNHWHTTPNGKKYHICNLNQLAYSEHEDFYCAYGERRADEQIH